jgi:type IV secretory pathway VirJ component
VSNARRTSRRRLPCAATLLIAAGLAWGIAACAKVPATAPVATSRGEFRLLVYPPAVGRADGGPRRPLVLLVSGEGGWREFDVLLAGWLRDAGYWVGGVDIKPYFQKPQDDRKALSADFRAYAAALAAAAGSAPDAPVVLAGFSFGADLAPWIAGAGGWEKSLVGLVLIGPDGIGSLEYRIREMLRIQPTAHVFSVAAALESAENLPVLFLHGGKDKVSAAPALAARFRGAKKLVVIPDAGHHFGGHEEEARAALLEGIEWLSTEAARASRRREP